MKELTRVTIIILRHVLYLVYLGPCPGLGVFMSCFYDDFHYD